MIKISWIIPLKFGGRLLGYTYDSGNHHFFMDSETYSTVHAYTPTWGQTTSAPLLAVGWARSPPFPRTWNSTGPLWEFERFMESHGIWGFPKMGEPKNGWLQGKILLKWMIWGYPYFRKPPFIAIDWPYRIYSTYSDIHV